MKLSNQILMAGAISLASVVAPRFLGKDVARMVSEPLNPDAVKAVKALGLAKQRLDAESPKVAPQTKSGLPTLTSNG